MILITSHVSEAILVLLEPFWRHWSMPVVPPELCYDCVNWVTCSKFWCFQSQIDTTQNKYPASLQYRVFVIIIKFNVQFISNKNIEQTFDKR